MTKTQIGLSVGVAVLLGMVSLYVQSKNDHTQNAEPHIVAEVETVATTTEMNWDETLVTERYAARVDRVDVVFEHSNYTKYRLQTNGLVRTGELNSERGYGDDIDATVYVLNWQKPEGEQMRYVRLTAEPEYLYMIDGNGEIIRGSRLTLIK